MAKGISRAEYMRKWRKANPEKVREIGRRSDRKRKNKLERAEKSKQRNRERYRDDPEFRESTLKRTREQKRVKRLDPEYREAERVKARQRRKHDSEYHNAELQYKRQYRKQPKVKVKEREYRLEYERARYHRDDQFKLTKSLRNRLRHALRGDQKAGSAVKDLGISTPEFKLYIENQFEPGMTWDNWGNGEGKWNLDHVIPLSSFDLTDRTEFLEACNWLNIQPMWWSENMEKRDKMPYGVR